MCERKSVSLEDVRPDLKRYYKPELNDGKLMSNIPASSHQFVTLICDVCEEMKTRKAHMYGHKRTNGTYNNVNLNCYCETLEGAYPEIAKQWHHEKNAPLSLKGIKRQSHRKVWWKCECGHEWKTMISHRTGSDKTGCPACYSKTSKGEKIVMDFIEKCTFNYVHQYHVNIEHKSVVYSVFYDVYIPELNLFIEIHGAQHFGESTGYFDHTPLVKRQEIDKLKQQYAVEHGHYMMIDYREHDPELTLKRFIDQFISFLEN